MKKYTLEDVCIIQSGGTPDRSNQEFYNAPFIPWVKVGDIEEGKAISKTEEFISEGGLKSIGNRVFEKGSVLLALYGSTLGKTALTDIKVSGNQAVLCLDSKNKDILLNTYLKYWFDFNKQRIIFKRKGGAQKNLNADYVKKLRISLPSLEVQKRNVFILESIESLIIRRRKTLELLEEYSNNIFLEMFLENDDFSSSSKYWGKIEDVVQQSIYGTSKKANIDRKGLPVVRMNNITYTGELDLCDIKWVELEERELENLTLRNGDILFNRTNSKELVGKTAVWDRGEGYTFAGYLVKIILKAEKMLPHYFSSYLNSHFGKKILFNKGRSSGNQVNFSPPLLKSQKILIPPMDLQVEYEQITVKLKDQEKALLKSLNLLEELFQSLIASIFEDNKKQVYDEIDMLIGDEIKLELLLNTITSADFESVELYSMEVEKLFKILERTELRNRMDTNYRKGIIQRLEKSRVIIETNKEYKNRKIDETTTS